MRELYVLCSVVSSVLMIGRPGELLFLYCNSSTFLKTYSLTLSLTLVNQAMYRMFLNYVKRFIYLFVFISSLRLRRRGCRGGEHQRRHFMARQYVTSSVNPTVRAGVIPTILATVSRATSPVSCPPVSATSDQLFDDRVVPSSAA